MLKRLTHLIRRLDREGMIFEPRLAQNIRSRAKPAGKLSCARYESASNGQGKEAAFAIRYAVAYMTATLAFRKAKT